MLRPYFVSGIILSSCLFACVPASDNGIGITDVVIDSLYVQLPINTSANLIQPTIWKEGKSELLGAYNYLDHSLSVINITDRRYEVQIRLKENGPDFVDAVNGLAYCGENRLLVSSIRYLTSIDFEGNVLDRVRLNDTSSDLKGFDFTVGRLEVSRHSGLQFDANSGEILLSAIVREADGLFRRYVASVNVLTKRVRLTEIPNFESRKQGEYFGNLNGFHFRRLDGGFIVNPSFASELVLLSNDYSHLFIRSSVTDNKASAYNRQSDKFANVVEHHIESVEFYPVFSSYDQSYFFRVHKGPLDQNTDKEPFYLIVTDKKFNKLLEQPFPENYYITPIVSREGLMFVAFNKHDDKLELIRYRFNQ